MRKIGIIVNKNKDEGLVFTRQASEFFCMRGIEVSVHEANSLSSKSFDVETCFLVVLGGDGTMLKACVLAAIHDKPLIGINLGSLGFLTDVDKESGLTALSKVLDGKISLEKRMLLEADFPTSKPLGIGGLLAVNEVNVRGNGRLTEFSLYVSESPLNSFRADGIVVATPTGSTAYSLSAGGPLLMPNAQMMVITPVSPHSFGTRPLVIGREDNVRIVVRGEARVLIDGSQRGTLTLGQSVQVSASKYFASIMKTSSSNIYTTLRKKKMIY